MWSFAGSLLLQVRRELAYQPSCYRLWLSNVMRAILDFGQKRTMLVTAPDYLVRTSPPSQGFKVQAKGGARVDFECLSQAQLSYIVDDQSMGHTPRSLPSFSSMHRDQYSATGASKLTPHRQHTSFRSVHVACRVSTFTSSYASYATSNHQRNVYLCFSSNLPGLLLQEEGSGTGEDGDDRGETSNDGSVADAVGVAGTGLGGS